MSINMLYKALNSNKKVIILDIDGTLKDLCKEHSIAISETLTKFKVGAIRQKSVLLINKIAMQMVKTGLFSTNHCKQKFLITIYALLSNKNISDFSKEYFKTYTEQVCIFSDVQQLLELLNSKKQVYFSTINKQNYNLEEYGIPQERIIYTNNCSKIVSYNKILKTIDANKKETVIIGDNIFDDLLSAKFLRVNCLLVNNYNSKVKEIICKLVNSKYLG